MLRPCQLSSHPEPPSATWSWFHLSDKPCNLLTCQIQCTLCVAVHQHWTLSTGSVSLFIFQNFISMLEFFAHNTNVMCSGCTIKSSHLFVIATKSVFEHRIFQDWSDRNCIAWMLVNVSEQYACLMYKLVPDRCRYELRITYFSCIYCTYTE